MNLEGNNNTTWNPTDGHITLWSVDRITVFLLIACNYRIAYESNLAKAAGSQVDGTACLTWSWSTICAFESATVYNVIYQPSKASDLVHAASFCQEPVNSNMVLKKPDGIFPDKDRSWLNCSDICKMLQNLRNAADCLFFPPLIKR
jgi:hypothetical protein